GNPDGPGVVSADGSSTHPGDHRRCRPRARTARKPLGIIRITAHLEQSTIRKLVEVQLSEQNRPLRGQLGPGGGVKIRSKIRKDLRTARRKNTLGIEVVLEPQRNTMKRSAPVAGSDLAVRASRVSPRSLLRDGNIRPQLPIAFRDPIEVRPGGFDR